MKTDRIQTWIVVHAGIQLRADAGAFGRNGVAGVGFDVVEEMAARAEGAPKDFWIRRGRRARWTGMFMRTACLSSGRSRGRGRGSPGRLSSGVRCKLWSGLSVLGWVRERCELIFFGLVWSSPVKPFQIWIETQRSGICCETLFDEGDPAILRPAAVYPAGAGVEEDGAGLGLRGRDGQGGEAQFGDAG